MSFERAQCFADARNGATFIKCVAKSISRDHVRVDVQANFNRTIKSIFIQYVLYYQWSTNEFKQFINVVEDFCGYMKGNKGNILISRIWPDLLPFSNLNHTCPYTPGNYFMTISNLSINSLAPSILVPSGRYRLELSGSDGYNGPIFIKGIIYGSISDHRIEIF